MSPYYPPGGGGASSSSAGLAGTGPFYLLHTSANGTLPLSKIISAGNNITITTNSVAVFIAATTGSGSGTPGGNDSEIQVNSQNAFAGFPNLRWVASSNSLDLNTAGRIRHGGVAEVDGIAPTGVTGLIWLDTSSSVAPVALNTSVFATTGSYFIVGSNESAYPFSKVIKAGSSVTTHTDSTSFYINAITNAGGGAVYAPTGGFYAVYSSDPLLTNEKIITAGTNLSIVTDSTTITFNSINKDRTYWIDTRSNHVVSATSNRWYVASQVGGANLATATTPINSANCFPFIATKDIKATRMGMSVTIAGSVTTQIQLGIYTNSADEVLFPFNAVSTSSFLTGSNAIIVSYNPAITLSANNLYWFCMLVTKSGVTAKTIDATSIWPALGLDGTMGNTPGYGYRIAVNPSNGFASVMVGSGVVASSVHVLAVQGSS